MSEEVLYGPCRKPWRDSLSAVAVSDEDGGLLVSPPSSDPLNLDGYVEVQGITSTFYQVPSSGMTKQQHDEAIEETERFLKKGCEFLLGFQSCLGFRCPPCLESPVTGLNIIGAGDPFNVTTPLSFRGKWIERNVLDYYASLWNAKLPHNPSDPETYWGYVTAGSAEGNIHAMWNARDHLSGCCFLLQ